MCIADFGLPTLNGARAAAISHSMKPLEQQIGLTSVNIKLKEVGLANIQINRGSDRLFYIKKTAGLRAFSASRKARSRQKDIPVGISLFVGLKNLDIDLKAGEQSRDKSNSATRGGGKTVEEIFTEFGGDNKQVLKQLQVQYDRSEQEFVPTSVIRKSIPVTVKATLEHLDLQIRCLSSDGKIPQKPFVVAISRGGKLFPDVEKFLLTFRTFS